MFKRPTTHETVSMFVHALVCARMSGGLDEVARLRFHKQHKKTDK